MRQSKDISDIIEKYLKKNNKIKIVSKEDFIEIGEIKKEEIGKLWNVIDILEFKKVIEKYGSHLLWSNNYSKGKKEKKCLT